MKLTIFKNVFYPIDLTVCYAMDCPMNFAIGSLLLFAVIIGSQLKVNAQTVKNKDLKVSITRHSYLFNEEFKKMFGLLQW